MGHAQRRFNAQRTLGAGLGWFCGEGPGPGIRGIVRGAMAARGAWAFIQVRSENLSWPGPTELP